MALGILGLPIPDETILTFSGFLVFQNELNLIPTLLFSFLGSITGISVSYIIGKKLGIKFLHRDYPLLHLSKEKFEKTNLWIRRYGSWLFFFGYFIPGVRHLTALAAGASEIPYKRFAIYALPGGFVWTSVFISLGFYAGYNWKIYSRIIQKNIPMIFLIAVIAAALFFLAGKLLQRLKR